MPLQTTSRLTVLILVDRNPVLVQIDVHVLSHVGVLLQVSLHLYQDDVVV